MNYFLVWRQTATYNLRRLREWWSYLYTAEGGQPPLSPCRRWTPLGCTQLCFCQTWSQTPVVSPFLFASLSDVPSPVRTNNFFFSCSSLFDCEFWPGGALSLPTVTIWNRQSKFCLVHQLKEISHTESKLTLFFLFEIHAYQQFGKLKFT